MPRVTALRPSRVSPVRAAAVRKPHKIIGNNALNISLHDEDPPLRCVSRREILPWLKAMWSTYLQWRNAESPEFRKKWPQFGKIADEIEPAFMT
jgi:hypothetical protein